MYTIIVVDDEEDLRKSLIRKIQWEKIGLSVVGEAENGIDALELVEKLEPDLLLTDIQMPFMTGIELAREVREIRPTTQIIFLSGYDDFSYAQQAIQYNIISYLLKPITVDDLTKELYKIKESLDQKFLQFSRHVEVQEQLEITNYLLPLLLDGHQIKKSKQYQEQIIKDGMKIGLLDGDTNNDQFTVIVCNFWDEKGENCTIPDYINVVEIILKKYMKYASIYLKNGIVSVLVGSPRDVAKYLHILVDDIAQSVKRVMKLEVTIGISRQVKQLDKLYQAYHDAMNASAECIQGDEFVRYISDIERTTFVEEDMVRNVIAEMDSKLRVASKEEINELLKSIQLLLEERKLNTRTFQFMMIQLLSIVYKIVYAIADKESAQKLECYVRIQEQLPYEEPLILWAQYVEYCMAVKEVILEQRMQSGSEICCQALELIQLEYDKPDTNLVSISKEISVSSNYLSALIKKSTGHTFVELLTKKRIDMAKSLLVHDDLKIKDITEKCGYNDQHYFSYCFKKVVGVSPNAYRREYENQNEAIT